MPETSPPVDEALPNSRPALSGRIAGPVQYQKVIMGRRLCLNLGGEAEEVALPIIGAIREVELLPCGDRDGDLQHNLVSIW